MTVAWKRRAAWALVVVVLILVIGAPALHFALHELHHDCDDGGPDHDDQDCPICLFGSTTAHVIPRYGVVLVLADQGAGYDAAERSTGRLHRTETRSRGPPRG